MPEQIPINSKLLSWARERAGWTIADAVSKYSRFSDWETGQSYPTYAQLESLSDDLKIPVAVFFFPAPPAIPPITETFRTLPNSEVQRLPKELRMLLRKGKAMQLNLAELTGGVNPAKRLITREIRLSLDTSIADMANVVRSYLGVSIGEQKSWSTLEEALNKWRMTLLAAGVYVFKDAFRLDQYSGFCLYDDVFPIIYVNNSSAKTRQIFTYFHELAHLLFQTSGIDFRNDDYLANLQTSDQLLEIFCNKFASEFLLPDDELSKLLVEKQATEALAEQVAKDFHVSREVVFRRFLDRGLISRKAYTDAVTRWVAQRQASLESGSSGNYYWTKLAYLGRDYVSLALSKYHQNQIDDERLALYLTTKVKNISTLEDYFLRGNV